MLAIITSCPFNLTDALTTFTQKNVTKASYCTSQTLCAALGTAAICKYLLECTVQLDMSQHHTLEAVVCGIYSFKMLH